MGLPVSAQIYRWRCAPRHLRTRRQLAAVGLRPGGQDIAGILPFQRYGRVQVAYLYDIALAKPKRPASAAQLAALDKARRERQIRVAERHGISRAELDQISDPGPGWVEAA